MSKRLIYLTVSVTSVGCGNSSPPASLEIPTIENASCEVRADEYMADMPMPRAPALPYSPLHHGAREWLQLPYQLGIPGSTSNQLDLTHEMKSICYPWTGE